MAFMSSTPALRWQQKLRQKLIGLFASQYRPARTAPNNQAHGPPHIQHENVSGENQNHNDNAAPR
jgi:hypothetical protein